MNLVKLLKKQIEADKQIITSDGNIVSSDDIRKAALKKYLTGVKIGEIDTTKSFEEYLKENDNVHMLVQDVIDFIEG